MNGNKKNQIQIDVFKLFWNDDIVDLIVLETNNYHQQKLGTELHVTKEEIYLVFGILILSGYVTVGTQSSTLMVNKIRY